jgi:hypothetical protein
MEKDIGLVVPLPQFQNVANFKKLVDITSARGFLVNGPVIEPWQFTGFLYRDGVPFVQGPAVAGLPLSAVLEQAHDQALAGVLAIARALAALPEADLAQVEIAPDSVYVLESGGVLFLPAEVFRKIRIMATEDYKTACSRLNNPYAENDRQRFSHALGVLLYRVLTGEFPYDGRDCDELHRRLRLHAVTPPRHLRPELKDEISVFLTDVFTNRKLPVRPAVWAEKLGGWIETGVTRDLGPEEQAELARTAGRFASRRSRQFSLKVFWERHGRAVIVTGVVALAVIVVIGSMVANALKPRRTAGMSARAVAESYYRCFNTLEPELMKDCLAGETAADERRRVEVMFVTTRQIYFTRGQEDRIPADVWDKRGRPTVDPPRYIDGVTTLVLSQESTSSASAVFTADYERWQADPESDDYKNFKLIQKGIRVKERLSLVKDDQGWLIANLERTAATPFYESTSGYQPGTGAP